ncbi:MAG: hypothetical protein ACPHM2_07285, partial [Alcanivorax sp.]
MSLPWSPRKKLELSPSRYPARLKWLAVIGVVPAILLTQMPWWALVLLLLALPLLVRGWQPPQLSQMELHEQGLTLIGRHWQELEQPRRVLRVGPWMAIQTPKGWLHLFD